MASVHTIPSLDEQFRFSPNLRKRLVIIGLVGLALVILGIILLATGVGEHHGVEHAGVGHAKGWMARVWANLWLNAVYFTGISVMGMFFMSYSYLSQTGWVVVFKRVYEAMPAFLPVTAGVILITFFLGGHDLFHWTHADLYEQGNPDYDPIMVHKRPYLNTPFYIIRLVAYFVAWYGLWMVLRKASLLEDRLGGLTYYERSIKFGVIFLVIFGITSSTSAWDFDMSIDAHWFSTMWGWYTLASWHVAGLAVITLLVVSLKENGYLRALNESHLHDLGKFVFAFTIFWTYVWFAQFLLYYYANIPEEVIYFRERFSGYDGIFKGPFFLNILLNFVLPFLVLMTRDSKRTFSTLKIACWSVVIGHYLDFYLNIMPGSLGKQTGFGPLEVGMFMVFASAFLWFVCKEFTKANLIPKNHPMLEESLHHDIA